MKAALLPDRGVVKVAGDDARGFLNGLLTSDIGRVTPDSTVFAALLTPQGKIIMDMIVAEAPAQDGGGFFLDVPKALAKSCVDRLNFYKLRAKVSTRMVPVAYDGLAPDAGAAVTAAEKQVGTFGSSAGGRALAMLRLDRAEDALAASHVLVAGAVTLRLVKLDWLRFALPGEQSPD